MSDPIQNALHAAAKVLAQDDADLLATPEDLTAKAAATIGAFLRALPDVMKLERKAPYASNVFVGGTRQRLAAAVESAALACTCPTRGPCAAQGCPRRPKEATHA